MFELRRIFIALFILAQSLSVRAKEATVFNVYRPLAMENGENPPKDYYINAGSQDGLRVGMLVSVTRRQTLYDPYQNKSPGELSVQVGLLRVVHVQNEISVARLESLNDSSFRPVLDLATILVGDRVDLSSAKMAPQKSAALTLPPPSTPAEIPASLGTPVPTVATPTQAEGSSQLSSMTP